jgi:uncharacterized membrane protein YhaH (DUF805 family)
MNFLFGFSGRFSRFEWWSVQILALAGVALFMVSMARAHGMSLEAISSLIDDSRFQSLQTEWIAGLVGIAFAGWLMSTAAMVKRYHDRNKSGFWYFVGVIPIVGVVWQVAECGFMAGTEERNRFDAESADQEPAYLRRSDQSAEPSGPPAHRLERALSTSAAKQAHNAKFGRRSYQS